MHTQHMPLCGDNPTKRLLLALSALMIAVPSQVNADPVNYLTFIPSASNPKVSGDGRFVAFESAEALVSWDTNGASDIYRLELATGSVLLASSGVNGLATAKSGLAESTNPSISADGNIIAFQSLADNLVDGDTNGDINPQRGSDVFVVNFSGNTINRVSERLLGNGNFEEGDWNSENPSISADGSLVAFSTGASNLAPDADTGDYTVYVYNNNDASLVAVPVPDGITPDDFVFCDFPAISGDGRFVAFEFEVVDSVSNPPAYSYSEVYRFGLADESLNRIGVPVNGGRVSSPSISADGRFTGFDTNFDIDDNDNNDGNDVYKYDATTDSFVWISRDGDSDALTVSGDGNSNLWNDRDLNVVKMTDQGLTTFFGQGRFSSISFDGNIVAFETLNGAIGIAQDAALVPLPPVTLTPAPVQPPVAQPVAAPATAPVSKPIAKPVAKPAPIPVANQVPSTKPVTKPGAATSATPPVAPKLKISDVPNQTVISGFSTVPIPVKITPVTGAFVLKASSSDQALVPDSGIVLGGSGVDRTVTIKAAANKSGPVTITLTVTDGKLTATDTFVLTVTPGKPQNFAVRFTAKGPAQVDGNVTRNIGKAKIKDKKGVTKTITITNTGTTPLRGLKIVRGGLAASDFMVLKLDKKPLAPKKSTSFEVVFKAKATGTRQAELQIFSSETPDNPFDLTVTGTGSR